MSNEGKGNRNLYRLHDTVWEDLYSPIVSARLPGANFPTLTNFGPDSAMQRMAFTKGDFVYLDFHVPHGIALNSKAYPHVHWTSNGTDTGNVVWKIEYTLAKGHQQAAYPSVSTVSLTQAGSGTAWQHMIVEAGDDDAVTLAEPDILIHVKLSRSNVAGDTNSDTIFGLAMDWHFQIDRIGTPDKSPDFWLADE